MLKLPKGLKKKKKKSKKDQELFTEAELEQYKREQRQKQEAKDQPQPTEGGETEAVADAEQPASTSAATAASEESAAAPPSEADEEWSKFKALTAGVDSILHKTQDELDRIKQTSFFQRLPTEAEKKKLDEEEAAAREAERIEKERVEAEVREANRDKLAEAVVELSESEEESEEVDDIFNTEYLDALAEVQLTVVDSPTFDIDDGPDPFDTAYAETVIHGPNKSKSGKKLVSLGAAVEVLSGRVDRDHALALSGAKKKPRKGVVDLLGDDGDLVAGLEDENGLAAVTPEPPKSLLDDFDDDFSDIPDGPIDLSSTLHLQLLQQQKEQRGEADGSGEEEDQKLPVVDDILSEFDVLKKEEDDEFAELAVESLNKKDEFQVITQPQAVNFTAEVEGNWAEFAPDPVEETTNTKAKPPRPPPPGRPATGPHIPPAAAVVAEESDDEFAIPDDDPFDTTFVEKVIVAKDEDDDDFDFDPRADETKPVAAPAARDLLGGSNPDLAEINPSSNLVVTLQKDLLAGSTTDLTSLSQSPIAPVKDSEEEEDDFDPFDTSRVANIVQPKSTELKFLEKELLADGLSDLKRSLSDPDFDPRADEPEAAPVKVLEVETSASRKSSLSLNLSSKTVGFSVPVNDLLAVGNDAGKVQKPLTPYYAPVEADITEKDDPFDTTFVPETKPSAIELKNLEKDLLTASLKHSLSDPDFDPRASDDDLGADLLAVQTQIDIKVLTPAQESKDVGDELDAYVDPFDTSIAANIAPGQTELKLLENEFVEAKTPDVTTVLDTLTDAQELGLGDKVLTPQVNLDEAAADVDPFDTSFASNLGPGKAEIKILENELIEN